MTPARSGGFFFVSRDKKKPLSERRNARRGLLLQRMGGIEPLTQAWEAGVLPLNYIRVPLLYHPGGGMSRSMGKFFRSRSDFLPTGSDSGRGREADASERFRGYLPEIRNPDFIGPDTLLRVKGLEPSRSCPHKNLNLARLPIPPHPRVGRSFERCYYTREAPFCQEGSEKFFEETCVFFVPAVD